MTYRAPQILAIGGEGIGIADDQHCGGLVTGDFEELMQLFLGLAEPNLEALVQASAEEIRAYFARSGAADEDLATHPRHLEE